jgi:hypothetical protein
MMRKMMMVLVLLLPGSVMAGGTELRVDAAHAVAVPGTDATVMLHAVQDVRCPSTVDCVWEGLIRVELAITDGRAREVIVLCNACDEAGRAAVVAGRRVTMMRLEPGRDVLDVLGRAAVLDDYTVVLAVAG